MAEGITVGPLTVGYFALLVLAALVAGGAIGAVRARQAGEDPSLLLDLGSAALLGGLIAARLFFVLNPPPSVAAYYDRAWFLSHPLDLQAGPLAVWSGGLSSAGALVGGGLACALMLWRRGVDLPRWADLLAPGILVGLAIAPWGNILTGQLYGPPTTLPWGMVVEQPLPPYPAGTRFHPTPAYLSLWALLCLGLVTLVGRRYAGRLRPGDRSLISLGTYALGLFAFDFLRLDVTRLVGLTETQWVALVLLIATLLALRRAPRQDGVQSAL
ncbi:MAG: prolipoprotein diacylglyceryl transferase [Anaerolineae bacterium]